MSDKQCRPWLSDIWLGPSVIAQAGLSQYLGLIWHVVCKQCSQISLHIHSFWSGPYLFVITAYNWSFPVLRVNFAYLSSTQSGPYLFFIPVYSIHWSKSPDKIRQMHRLICWYYMAAGPFFLGLCIIFSVTWLLFLSWLKNCDKVG